MGDETTVLVRPETTEVCNVLWEAHRDFLKRLLLSLTRDPDLAEDLLQETYLLAHRGWAGFRGGDVRAWLTTIARHAVVSHKRRCAARGEVALEIDAEAPAAPMDPHLLVDLRRAIADLPQEMRHALLLRFYGGLSYQEIADRAKCPVGTVKWRVSVAIGRLKTALGVPRQEGPAMRCSGVSVRELLDGLLGGQKTQGKGHLRDHLTRCRSCREEARHLTHIVSTMKAVEDAYAVLRVIDVDQAGMPTQYTWRRTRNTTGESLTRAWGRLPAETVLDYALYDGADVDITLWRSGTYLEYQAILPHAIPPGGHIERLLVTHAVGESGRAESGDGEHWRFAVCDAPNHSWDCVYALTVCLPAGAELTSAEPSPTRQDGSTVTWHLLLPKMAWSLGEHWTYPVACTVEYRLPMIKATTVLASPAPSPYAVREKPELASVIQALTLSDTESRESCLRVFHAAQAGEFPCPMEWHWLGLCLYSIEAYMEAFSAFDHVSRLPEVAEHDPTLLFGARAMQGQIMEQFGHHVEAIALYDQALLVDIGKNFLECSSLGIRLDRAVVEERLTILCQRH